MQWNRFRKTQLDSHSGHSISADRFWKSTGWPAAHLAGRWVLDIGCGAGRFAEIALQAGANVVAVDYSSAVDACYANLGHHRNLHVVQGNVYALPFEEQRFSYVYSLGVLQHTPNVQRAVQALPAMARDGGRLCIDFYEKSWRSAATPKYWLRPITKRVPQERLFSALERWVPHLLALSRGVGRLPLAGRILKRLVPVANYEGVLPLTETQLREWAVLDTFDWFSPAFDNPQTGRTVADWLRRMDVREIEVLKIGHLVARGIVEHAPRD